MKKWLWLEDQISTVEDLRSTLTKLGLSMDLYQTPSQLIDYLVDIKISYPDQLKNIGLILDVMLTAQRYITCPVKWYGGEQPLYLPTQDGYDAGLIFYEKLILGIDISKKPLWNPPPPVLFLTVLHTDFKDTEQRLEVIRTEWARAYSIKPEQARVKWLRKWEANLDTLKEIFKEGEEL
jgi:hypothetical protein